MRSSLCATLSALALLLASAGARAATSTLQNPVFTYSTPGSYTVTLRACRNDLCTNTSKTVTVLDPRPAITLATTDGAVGGVVSVHAGELVHLVGNGTGKPALSFEWRVVPVLAGPPTAILPGAEGWWDTTGATPGSYAATLYLANDFGAVDSSLTPLTIVVLPEVPLEFYTLAPCRVFDSRAGNGALVSGEAITLTVDICGVPPSARALAVNVTVVSPTAAGKLNLYPGNYPVPGTAESSFRAGVTRANSVVVGLATAGPQTLAARAEMSGGGTVHVIVDVSGYFAPALP